jgi:hypothetical protein
MSRATNLWVWYYNCSNYRSANCPSKIKIKEQPNGTHTETPKGVHICSAATPMGAINNNFDIEKEFISRAALG